MLRLPEFSYFQPTTIAEAVALKDAHGDRAMFVSGGTDLYPNMKRRQQEPRVVISLAKVDQLNAIEMRDGGIHLGAKLTLTSLASDQRLQAGWPAFAHAASSIATPLLRNMGTLGGNLCLDTRCNYYDQSYPWRKALGFCMKKDGDTCWVAPSSAKCWAVQSSDLAPVVAALGGRIELVGPKGARTLAAEAFYNDDGIRYLNKEPGELVTGLWLPEIAGARSSYIKVAQRGSFDFPVLGVAAWARFDQQQKIAELRLVLGAIAPAPRLVPDLDKLLIGRSLDDRQAIAAAAEVAWRLARPLDNTDQAFSWRKSVVKPYVERALLGLAAR
ncbi:MAG: FAD binding domain-containing protein [Deltaproteobacteria bacterium]|nr:FAD binding domain-containing protein [Deltaproteobacteria bacterium]